LSVVSSAVAFVELDCFNGDAWSCIIQGASRNIREHSGNIQGRFRQRSRNVQGAFREHSGRTQTFRKYQASGATSGVTSSHRNHSDDDDNKPVRLDCRRPLR
jgi:hypothetical protein